MANLIGNLNCRPFLLKKGRLVLQCDELWSFIGNKQEQAWIWLALDAETQLIVGCATGRRDIETAQELWDFLPPE